MTFKLDTSSSRTGTPARTADSSSSRSTGPSFDAPSAGAGGSLSDRQRVEYVRTELHRIRQTVRHLMEQVLDLADMLGE